MVHKITKKKQEDIKMFIQQKEKQKKEEKCDHSLTDMRRSVKNKKKLVKQINVENH